MEGRSLETKMIGQDVKMPVAIAPTGFTGMARRRRNLGGAGGGKIWYSVYAVDHVHLFGLKMWLKTPARRFGFSFM